MGDLPGSGIELGSPALAGKFFTTESLRKPSFSILNPPILILILSKPQDKNTQVRFWLALGQFVPVEFYLSLHGEYRKPSASLLKDSIILLFFFFFPAQCLLRVSLLYFWCTFVCANLYIIHRFLIMYFLEVKLSYNAVLVYAVQQSDSLLHIHVYSFSYSFPLVYHRMLERVIWAVQ